MSAAPLYKEFRLTSSGGAWEAFRGFLKANAEAVFNAGDTILLIVTSERRRRTNAQNRYFHGPFLDQVAEQGWIGGRQFPKLVWKEYFRQLYLLKGEIELPDGRIVQEFWSTKDLSDEDFAAFVQKCTAYAAREAGVVFES